MLTNSGAKPDVNLKKTRPPDVLKSNQFVEDLNIIASLPVDTDG
ncbi:MAG TPA: hypothetical protein VKB19_00300 [Pedobacter sp.]|nr:hypothetical protein [Pedobacter sp.]